MLHRYNTKVPPRIENRIATLMISKVRRHFPAGFLFLNISIQYIVPADISKALLSILFSLFSGRILLFGKSASVVSRHPYNGFIMRTPLYQEHVALKARIAPFGGWEMPIQYDGILAEHTHTRTMCSIFDICHMGEFQISGPTAQTDLDHLLTQAITTLNIGQCRYGYLLREDGGVLDDLTCYRLGEDRFYLVVNAATCSSDAEWIQKNLSDTTLFEDLSSHTAKLDLQGPAARACMERVLGVTLPDLKYFRAAEIEIAGMPCILSRTGYTGEWGYEIYFPWEEASRLWKLFLSDDIIKPAGLGARDTLRLEMGYPLYGHELSKERTPVAASRGMFIHVEKEFIGKKSVMHDLQGVDRYLAGLQLETKRAARRHDNVICDGLVIGEVSSGSLGPSLGTAIAMAYLDASFCKPGQRVSIRVHGKELGAVVVELPFYKQGTARRKSSVTAL